MIRLEHVESHFYLHSHGIRYGAGSKQQSITAVESQDDEGNLWLVKEALGEQPCTTGAPIKCDEFVRLEHVATERNLHTHTVTSPLSGQQEVSCYEPREEGDSNDNWRVQCSEERGVKPQVWARDTKVTLQSKNQGAYLHSHSQHRFTQKNCPNCPIIGQQEVTCFKEQNPQNLWTVDGGVFVTPS